MEIAIVLRDPNPPHSSLGAWIFLSAVFLSGTLFQACVPRLCQLGQRVGGILLKPVTTFWHFFNHARQRGAGTVAQKGDIDHPEHPRLQSMGRLRVQSEGPPTGSI